MLRSELLPLLRSVGRSPRSPNYTGSTGLPPIPKSPHSFLRIPHTCTALYPSPSQAQQSLNITSCWPVFKDTSPKITVLVKQGRATGLVPTATSTQAPTAGLSSRPPLGAARPARAGERPDLDQAACVELCAPPPVVLGRGASEPVWTTGSGVGALV